MVVAEKKPRTIAEWSSIFKEIYSAADTKRSTEQICIAIVAHASTIGESIRTISFEKLVKSAAHFFCWLCSFVNKCNALQNDVFSINESLCGIVSLKYPGVCGRCTKQPCQCDPVEMESKSNKSAKYKKLFEEHRPIILDSFENYTIESSLSMFNKIYAGRIHIHTLEGIGFHFLEEVGEAAVAIRELGQLRNVTTYPETKIDAHFIDEMTSVKGIVEKYEKYFGEGEQEIKVESRDPEMLKWRVVHAKMDIISEIGDTFSWFCAIQNKLAAISKSILDKPDPSRFPTLTQMLEKEYIGEDAKARCPTCLSNPCKCAFYDEAYKQS